MICVDWKKNAKSMKDEEIVQIHSTLTNLSTQSKSEATTLK
jgi:hypothetical protein